MIIDKRYLRAFLPTIGPSKYTCPTCQIGKLSVDPNKVLYQQTAESIRFQKMPEWDPEWVVYVFSALLTCNNTECNDVLCCSGVGTVQDHQYYDNEGRPNSDWLDVFEATIFTPNLQFFAFPDGLAESVASELNASFAVFFFDLDSAANHIRSSIELLLTELKVTRYKRVPNKKTHRYSLHQRIERLPPKYNDVKDMFMAIKLVGNQGSHGAGKVDKMLIYNAYEIIEQIFYHLYENTFQTTQLKARKIVKSKSR